MQGGQDHLGMLRRCLHFDNGQHENTTSVSDSSNALENEDVSRAAVPTAGKGLINPSSQDKTAHPTDKQLPNSSFPQTIGESIGKGTKPSGFGLHLNSFINSVQHGATVSMKSVGSGTLSIHGKPSSIIRLSSSESSRSCSLSCNEANQFLPNTNNDRIERDQARDQAVAASTEQSEFEYLNPLSTSNSNINEELSQLSPKKKRLKKLHVDGGDGCKRCNCKKSKCLKLYCDCFAAGIYCAEPCACQGCFNKPEYKDIVIGTRLQIESRNPHAFAPKIIQHATEASTKKSMEDVILSSSARHKRGCNCKKSMCLKKYCECYQANVGCSDGCRCDGCQNVYGRKEEFGKNKHPRKQDISELCDVGEKHQEVASTNDTLQFSPLELTPETPPFQCSNPEKDGSKSWFPSGRYLPSPESVTFADSYPISPGSSGNINNHGFIQDINKDILHLVPSHRESDNGNLVTADEFLHAYHGPGGAGSMTNHSSLLGPHDYQATRMEPPCIYENRNLPSGSSLQWRRSPISLLTNFEENKYLGSMDFNTGICEAPEDDTPDILKDNVTPLNSVKVCSPNKKRVSPPQAIVQELGSSSSAGLKTCRKFILKSVPSFHQSIDSKDKNPEPKQ